jgi:hypothetical protein
MNLKMIPCRTCGNDMPELRLTKYNYTFCVPCSESGMGDETKKGITVLMGEGDHTWVETIIMDDNDYRSYLCDKEEESKNTKSNEKETKNLDNPPPPKVEAVEKV